MSRLRPIIGNAARGERYYPRPEVSDDIIESLDNGSHLLITAPRRIGKTSVLCHLMDNPTEEYYFVYTDTEHLEEIPGHRRH